LTHALADLGSGRNGSPINLILWPQIQKLFNGLFQGHLSAFLFALGFCVRSQEERINYLIG